MVPLFVADAGRPDAGLEARRSCRRDRAACWPAMAGDRCGLLLWLGLHDFRRQPRRWLGIGARRLGDRGLAERAGAAARRRPAARSRRGSSARARGLPRSAWAMTMAHAGLGVLILGITVQSAGQVERILVMQPGETARPRRLRRPVRRRGRRSQGPNYTRPARDLHRDPRRRAGRPCSLRAALLPGRADADHRGRHQHQPVARSLRRPGRPGRERRLRGPALLQPAGARGSGAGPGSWRWPGWSRSPTGGSGSARRARRGCRPRRPTAGA